MTHEEALLRRREVLGRKPTEEELQQAIKMDKEDENVQNYQNAHYEDLDRIRSAAQNRRAALAY